MSVYVFPWTVHVMNRLCNTFLRVLNFYSVLSTRPQSLYLTLHGLRLAPRWHRSYASIGSPRPLLRHDEPAARRRATTGARRRHRAHAHRRARLEAAGDARGVVGGEGGAHEQRDGRVVEQQRLGRRRPPMLKTSPVWPDSPPGGTRSGRFRPRAAPCFGHPRPISPFSAPVSWPDGPRFQHGRPPEGQRHRPQEGEERRRQHERRCEGERAVARAAEAEQRRHRRDRRRREEDEEQRRRDGVDVARRGVGSWRRVTRSASVDSGGLKP